MFGKIFLVFTAVVSVLLAGVSIVAFFAVPGMGQAMKKLPDYSFEPQAGERITWNVSRRLGDQGPVASNVNAFDAVLKARADMQRIVQEESRQVTDLLSTVNQQLELFEAEQQQDVQAMDERVTALESDAEVYQQKVQEKSVEFQNLSAQARDKRSETSLLREDVVRLQAELEELRTHQYELLERRRTLMDQWLRIQLNNQTLEQREAQIVQQMVP